jgi:hypothetical protein
MPSVGLPVVLVGHDLDSKVVDDIYVGAIRDAEDFLERSFPALDFVRPMVKLPDGAERAAIAASAGGLEGIGAGIIEEIIVVSIRIAELAEGLGTLVHPVVVMQYEIANLRFGHGGVERVISIAIVEAWDPVEPAFASELGNQLGKDLLPLATDDRIDLRNVEVHGREGDVMATHNDRQRRIDGLHIARELLNNGNVCGVPTLQSDQIRLEPLDVGRQICLRRAKVRQLTRRNVSDGSGEILQTQGLNANGVVETGGISTLGFDKQNAPYARFKITTSDDVYHGRRPLI